MTTIGVFSIKCAQAFDSIIHSISPKNSGSGARRRALNVLQPSAPLCHSFAQILKSFCSHDIRRSTVTNVKILMGPFRRSTMFYFTSGQNSRWRCVQYTCQASRGRTFFLWVVINKPKKMFETLMVPHKKQDRNLRWQEIRDENSCQFFFCLNTFSDTNI